MFLVICSPSVLCWELISLKYLWRSSRVGSTFFGVGSYFCIFLFDYSEVFPCIKAVIVWRSVDPLLSGGMTRDSCYAVAPASPSFCTGLLGVFSFTAISRSSSSFSDLSEASISSPSLNKCRGFKVPNPSFSDFYCWLARIMFLKGLDY